ncbi:MAG: sugar-transfer associated ATP-grasp domain-containing protein [Kiloniellales bacterium]
MRIARARYGKPYRKLVPRFFHLLLKRHFTPKDIFVWDLLAKDSLEEVVDAVISKRDLLTIQQGLNPGAAAALTENKILFSSHCRARGLPVPRLLAAVGPRIGWTAEGDVVLHSSQWARLIEGLPASEIVIKPAHGAYGRGIRFFSRQGERWCDEAGRLVAAAGILQGMRQGGARDDFIVEERVRPHPDLKRLSGTDYLQTTRIVTLIAEQGGAEIIFAVMKLIGGDATTDNFSFGASGNMVGEISVATGRIKWMRTARPDGVGLVEVTEHPVTGAALRDFLLPSWQETCELARRAQQQFLPLLTVGWDIAFTPDGPLLIEGNAWWDPPNQLRWAANFRAHAEPPLGRPAPLQPGL